MGLFSKLKSKFSVPNYKINKEILVNYINEQIDFSKNENLPFADEFFITKNVDDKDRIHLTIINYDVPCTDSMDSEKNLKGIIIWVNSGDMYNPESDEKYYSAEDLVNIKIADYPEEFILINENGAPVSLEKYKLD